MKSKVVKILLLLTIVSMYVSSTVVYGASLRINSITQERSNWCWAACAEMVGKWENPTSTRTQKQIVAYVKGSSLINMGASALEAVEAAEYASNFVADYNCSGFFSKANVNQMINDYNNPFIAGCTYKNSTSGHMLVVHGLDSSYNVYIKDPATGSSKWISYDSLCTSYGNRYWSTTVYTYFDSID